MRFRIAHISFAAVFVAVFAAALANPNYYWSSAMQFGAWFLYATIAVRTVVCEGRERLVLVSALILGLSYLWLSYWTNSGLITSELVLYGWQQLHPQPEKPRGFNWDNFRQIGEIELSFVFAIIGGALAAIWSKKHDVDHA